MSGAFRRLELPDKICPVCGRRFNRRRYGGRLEDRGAYELRKHCSRRCLGVASSRAQRSGRADLAAGSAGPYQLPVADLAVARRVGPRLWKKQVLPVGRVSYRGRTLDFSRRVLERIARNFRERVFDYTPVNAATADNMHNEDPFRFLGEVKDLSVERDGLYMIFEPNARGEELLRSNPKIGASVRYFANFVRPRDGREVGPVVRHVVLTQDPHVSGMVAGAYLSAGGAAGVIDLTRGTYELGGSMTMTPDAAARAAANMRRATPAQRAAMIERRRAQVGEGRLRSEMAQIAAANGAEYEAVLRSSGGERHRAGHSTGGVY